MLVAPVVDAQTKRADRRRAAHQHQVAASRFRRRWRKASSLLCETLAIALRQRQRPMAPIKGKYDYLVANAVLSAEELELATRSARRKNLDIETVLIDEFQVKPSAIGEALASLLRRALRAVQAGPHQAAGPAEEPEARIRREQPVGADRRHQGGHGRADDRPGALRGSRIVNNVFPKGKIIYRVCCNREFTETLDQFFGATTGAMDRRIDRRPAVRHGRRGRRAATRRSRT